jgi:hypothetical protein
MPDAARTTQPVEDDAALDYDAFLSYTHGDRPVVSGIQKGLHHIGRRVGQLRALRVFRDDTDLTASPDLWDQRRFRRLRSAAVAALTVLTVIAVVAGVMAAGQRQEANRQRVAAIAQTLDAGAQARLAGALPGGDIRAFQELSAARALRPPGHDGPLLHALAILFGQIDKRRKSCREVHF